MLAVLTIVWGLNWPVMKLGVTGYPPLAFRVLSMWLGLPVLWALLRLRHVRFAIRREDWRELAKLSFNNMIVWHIVAILALQALSSGRAAILGWWLNEELHWQDGAAIVLVLLAIASVMIPPRRGAAAQPPPELA